MLLVDFFAPHSITGVRALLRRHHRTEPHPLLMIFYFLLL
jgi:hypothetical protein